MSVWIFYHDKSFSRRHSSGRFPITVLQARAGGINDILPKCRLVVLFTSIGGTKDEKGENFLNTQKGKSKWKIGYFA